MGGQTRTSGWAIRATALLVLLGLGPAALAAPAGLNGMDIATPRLKLNEVVTANVNEDGPAEFVIHITEPGILTVALRGQPPLDLRIKVTDQFYQPVIGGEVDADLGGDLAAEQAAMTIERPGDYRLVVETWNGRGSFRVVSGFLPFPEVGAGGADVDPDATPDQARRLVPGEPQEAQLTPAEGDRWDWYRIEAPGKGQLIVTTDGPEGDIVLTAYVQGRYREPIDRSDQDRGGNAASEALVLDVEADQVYLVKVDTFGGQPVPRYTIRATFAP